jgi:hypothetical protein
MEPDRERAFIGIYERSGYMNKDRLVILDVKKRQLYTNLIERRGKRKSTSLNKI